MWRLLRTSMALCLGRLSQDWQESYGHPILVVESFIDTQLFRGASCKATGWRAVGCTTGFKRVVQDFYQAHERPKQLYVRELVKHAVRTLRACRLPPALSGYERKAAPRCHLSEDQARDLWQVLHREVPESRNVHGLPHKQAAVLAIVSAYFFTGGLGSGRDGPAVRHHVPLEQIGRSLRIVAAESAVQRQLLRDPLGAHHYLGYAQPAGPSTSWPATAPAETTTFGPEQLGLALKVAPLCRRPNPSLTQGCYAP